MNNKLNYDFIIYHSPCSDGTASAWVVKHFNQYAQLIPCVAGLNPQINIEEFRNKNIIFTDLCPNNSYLISLKSIASNITILDHHITAYKSMDTSILDSHNINYYFDNNQSGCMITWKYFSQEPLPWFLDYIGDRDLWEWKLISSKEINTTLFEDDHINFKGLTKLFEYDDFSLIKSLDSFQSSSLYKSFVERGILILNFKEKQIKMCMKSAIHCKYQSKSNIIYNIWLYTSSPDILSEVGNSLMSKKMKDESKPDFTVCWRYNVPTHEYYISMRSTSTNVDVSEIAKEFGGGGHRNASGFTLDGNKFILNNVFLPQLFP